jgi:hypothetical protein
MLCMRHSCGSEREGRARKPAADSCDGVCSASTSSGDHASVPRSRRFIPAGEAMVALVRRKQPWSNEPADGVRADHISSCAGSPEASPASIGASLPQKIDATNELTCERANRFRKQWSGRQGRHQAAHVIDVFCPRTSVKNIACTEAPLTCTLAYMESYPTRLRCLCTNVLGRATPPVVMQR